MAEEQKIERVVRKLLASDLRVIGREDIDGSNGARQWYALRTRPGKEAVAEVLMLQAGHLAFCPIEVVQRKFNRYHRKPGPHPRPMLTSMILAAWDVPPPWYHVFRLNVIMGVVGSGVEPTPIPHKAVRRMLRLSGKAAELRKPPFTVKAGIRAVIGDGPFEGLEGRVIDCTDKRARILLDLDGANHPLDVPVALLAQAG